MKPYLYILAVLLIGGGAGYYLGLKTASYEMSQISTSQPQDNQQALLGLLERQKESYSLHDELLLLRDCAENYVEINASTGESYNLNRATLIYHEKFKNGKSVNLAIQKPEVEVLGLSAIVKGSYYKTSDADENQGIKGYTGKGTWICSKSNGRWTINSLCFLEEVKR